MTDQTLRQQRIASARRIVVKVGTGALTDDEGLMDRGVITHLAGQIAKLRERGIAVTLVASGAIAAGLGRLDMRRRPKDMSMLQAVAAVGQGRLLRMFTDAFAKRNAIAAQVLVTRDDFEDRTRYLNIRNTLRALDECGAIAVINENDAVSIDEIRYGDNDIISAHVANMLGAELLVLLTNVDGVMDGQAVVDVIEEVDESAMQLARGDKSRQGSGGMVTKLTAAGIVTQAGAAAVIAPAKLPKVLLRVLDGEAIGTLFVPSERRISSRRRWIGQASRPEGTLAVDAGAARALTEGGKSLLPSGITGVTGEFDKGATVAIEDPDGREIARGLTNYSAEHTRQILGLQSAEIEAVLGDRPYDEVVHRNNMMLQ